MKIVPNDDEKGLECEHCGNHTVYMYRFTGCMGCGAPICCSFCCSETTKAMFPKDEDE